MQYRGTRNLRVLQAAQCRWIKIKVCVGNSGGEFLGCTTLCDRTALTFRRVPRVLLVLGEQHVPLHVFNQLDQTTLRGVQFCAWRGGDALLQPVYLGLKYRVFGCQHHDLRQGEVIAPIYGVATCLTCQQSRPLCSKQKLTPAAEGPYPEDLNRWTHHVNTLGAAVAVDIQDRGEEEEASSAGFPGRQGEKRYDRPATKTKATSQL